MAIRNDAAQSVVTDLVAALNAQRANLSEIDGAIGDGDHGIDMSKGFTAAGVRLAASPAPRLSAALAVPFPAALDEMTSAAEKGRDSTKDMVARVGRASRLGERSRGVVDAGATSCALILATMAKSLRALGAG